MKTRKDVITKEDFDNYRKEQQLLVDKLNNKVELLNKKNKRVILFVMLICLFISGITSVASYTLGASSVEFSPRDSSWNVGNTQEALDDLFDSVGSALVGSVYSYMGVNVPLGYLACDGSTYNIADYPRLAGHIKGNFGSYNYFGGDGETTFAVPDLRGEFLRGTGTNSHNSQGSGLSVGTHQDGTQHLRTYVSNTYIGIYKGSAGEDNIIDADTLVPGTGWVTASASKTNAQTSAYYTARPTNTSVLYIIKY